MSSLFLGVRLPTKTYERISINDINLDNSVKQLKNELSQKINFPSGEMGKKKTIFIKTYLKINYFCYLKNFYTVEKF